MLNPVYYLEPFCGSCWVAELVNARIRVCSDLNTDLILMWQALQAGWEPPSEVTEEDYRQAKAESSPSALRAFIGFGCSYAGKFFGGYARGGHEADAKTAKSQLRKRMYAKTAKSNGLHDIQFMHGDYREAIAVMPEADVIYCDPPYLNTTKFYGLADFDSELFWTVVRSYSLRGRALLVSEYSAPPDFLEVLSIPTRTDIRSGKGELIPRTEKLFIHRSSWQ